MVLVITSAAAHAQAPQFIKEFNDWSVYAFTGQKGKVCYAVSQPRVKSPSNRDHGDVFFFISTRPGENVSAEPSVIVGYTFKADSKVKVTVDGQSFTMFTQGEGAWIEKAAEESKLVDAMRAGKDMKVEGTSTRGTATSYTYSLSGVTAALEASAARCK